MENIWYLVMLIHAVPWISCSFSMQYPIFSLTVSVGYRPNICMSEVVYQIVHCTGWKCRLYAKSNQTTHRSSIYTHSPYNRLGRWDWIGYVSMHYWQKQTDQAFNLPQVDISSWSKIWKCLLQSTYKTVHFHRWIWSRTHSY